MGIPVIASRRGVLPQIVESGSTGLVISEQEEELRDALVDVARSRSEWAARGKAARERALRQHTLPLYAERLERFYVSLDNPTR